MSFNTKNWLQKKKMLNGAVDSTMGRFMSRFTQSDKMIDNENEMQRQEKAGVSGIINYALFSILGQTLDFDQIIVPLDDESLKIRFDFKKRSKEL